MADIGVFTKNADIQARAGESANSTAKATAATDVYVLDVEAYINAVTHFNWSDAYSSLNADVKGLLTEASASLCAMKVISYDMSGFTSRAEAETMLDVLAYNASKAIALLKDQETKTFLNEA